MDKTRITLLTLALLTITTSEVSAIVTGADLVIEARKYASPYAKLPAAYSKAQPPIKELKGEENVNGYYNYGWVFDIPSWDGGFDCSGLVSYCADLRRHYNVQDSELAKILKGGITWEKASPGDLIMSKDHISIFVNWWYNKSNNRYEVTYISAYISSATKTSGVRENTVSQGYFDKDSLLYSFRPSEPSYIKASINGRMLSNEKKNCFEKKSNSDKFILDYGAENPLIEDVLEKGNYPKNYEFTDVGTYTVEVKAFDWANKGA